MVLELLRNPKKVVDNPVEMIMIGFVYAFVAAFLALWVFKNYVSIVMITLTIVASIPFVHSVINREEEKEKVIKKERRLLKEHGKAIRAFLYLYLGFLIAFTALYVFMPENVANTMFSAQMETIHVVQTSNHLTGNFVSPMDAFNIIFFNNIKILVFCLLFSFFYGAGAIFILTWNASVMGTAIGAAIKNNMVHATGLFGQTSVAVFGFFQYFLHGGLEIAAYFIGALASGMVSFAIMKHDINRENVKRIMRDVSVLVIVAIALLVVAGLVEVYVTPLLF